MSRRSKLDRIFEELPDTAAEKLLEVLEDPGTAHTEIAETLTRNGYEVNEASVRRWRARA